MASASSFIGGMTTQINSVHIRLHNAVSGPSFPQDIRDRILNVLYDLRCASEDAISFASNFTNFRGHARDAATAAQLQLEDSTRTDALRDEE